MNTTGFEALRDILGPNSYELKFYPAPGSQHAPFALIYPGVDHGVGLAGGLPARAGWMRLLHSGKSTGQQNKVILAGMLLPC